MRTLKTLVLTATVIVAGIALTSGVPGASLNPLVPSGPPQLTSATAANPVTVEDTDIGSGVNRFTYTGGWTACTGCQPATSNSSYQSTTTTGSYATLTFNGTQASLSVIDAPDGGIASVSIDGASSVNVDTYAATAVSGKAFTTPVMAAGTHTVVVTDTGTADPSSIGDVVSIDFATIMPSPNAVLYGAAGTFGNLSTGLPTGQTLQTDAVPGWGFAPGEEEFFTTQASTGEIVIGTNAQTNNEKYATANEMEFGIFNPSLNTFDNLVIPTSTGSLLTTNPFASIGGATVDGLTPVTVAGVPRVAFTSMVPYNGWDTTKFGQYPTLGYLDSTTGSLNFNPSMSVDANQIFNYGGLSAAACPESNNAFGQPVGWCRGPAEMAVLPLSQKFIVSQYFQDLYHGNQHSGRLVVMNTDGSIAASYTYPNIPNPAGGFYTVNPREVEVDPTSTGTIEYFTVIFDVVVGGKVVVAPIQEFSYNDTTNRLAPVSLPVLSGQTSAGQPDRFQIAKYDDQGNLWVTQSVVGTLGAGPIVIYPKINGVRSLETTCASPSGWSGANWDSACAPGVTVATTGSNGQTLSLTEDPTTHMMFAATLSGYLLRIQQSGSGASLTATVLTPINFGLSRLVPSRATSNIGVRSGVIDNYNRALYLPIYQAYNKTDCPTWPPTTPCKPRVLNQWLIRFDLSALSS